MCMYVFLSFSFLENVTLFPLEWIGSIACLAGLMPSLFSLHDAKALCVILLSPSPCVSTLISESVVKRSWSQSDIRLQTRKLHQLCICSHSSCLCCPFHWIPRKSLLSPAHISYGSSGTFTVLICIYHVPFIMSSKTHNHEFHCSLWLVPDCLPWHRILFWMHSCS